VFSWQNFNIIGALPQGLFCVYLPYVSRSVSTSYGAGGVRRVTR
jgi:hypothetical protein